MSLAACSGREEAQNGLTPSDSPSGSTKETTATASGKNIRNISLTGAGASFPSPLYQSWFQAYVSLPESVLKKVAAAADAISPDYKIAIDVNHSVASASK
ncbi:hypothetical protein F7734_08450 [Scytonema sp. UIC 10036]|uniref:hypothetical protein n=1 Tax=Scytonema sp. UIC 10036 TaxID=2304196 RepID=UPI0012DAC702|nr:hypothetical protein [Scytonema sp. UIC 10036]MUG92485.1 hypothetical protein [Scytonema sp. UIC 10036]